MKKLDPVEDLGKETSIFNHIASNISIFVIALISLIVTIMVIMLLCKGAKMWALITNLVMQKSVKVLTEGKENCSNYDYWIIITLLILILLGIIFLIIEKAHRMPIFRKHWYSNTIRVLIFISNIKSYVPIKLCKTTGSIHLFKLIGRLQKEDIMLHRNKVWDILEIDWNYVTLMVHGNVVNLPGSVIVPFWDTFKIRQMIGSKHLLLHLMLKQEQTWYPLSNMWEMMEIEENNSESIEMQVGP